MRLLPPRLRTLGPVPRGPVPTRRSCAAALVLAAALALPAAAAAAPRAPSPLRAASAPAAGVLPPACSLLTLAAVRTLVPQVTGVEDLGLSCAFVDAGQRAVVTLAVERMGGAPARQMLATLGGEVLVPLSGLGSSAACTYQKAQKGVPAHLTAMAAVRDGVGVELLFARAIAGSAPGGTRFAAWRALLAEALARVGRAGPAVLPNPCALLTLAEVRAVLPHVAAAVRQGPLCAYDAASGSLLLTVGVQRESQDAQALFFPVGLVTIGAIAGIGQSAAFEYQQADVGVPGHLAALAAVQGGVGISIVLMSVVSDSAPGQPAFAKWKALLAAAVRRM